MKVLLVNLEGRIGGGEKSLLGLVRHLRDRYELSVACPCRGGLFKAVSGLDVRCHSIPQPPCCSFFSVEWFVYWMICSLRLLQIVFKTKPHVVHANNLPAGMVSLASTFFTGRKLLVHSRDLGRFGFLEKFVFKFCAGVIAVSETVKDRPGVSGCDSSLVKVIYSGVEGQPGIASTSKSIQRDKDGFVFANIGQFVPWKKQIVFLRAAELASREIQEAKFFLVGDDVFGRETAYKRFLLHRIKESSLVDKVILTGWRSNMEAIWREVDCLVHTAQREPFGRVIAEAMLRKVPVVAFDACGPGEIIISGHTGILVRSGDERELAQAMIRIYRERHYVERLVCNGYEYAESHFLSSRTADEVGRVYNTIASMN
ncbi:MAG: glycosyltransferase family 4 protein [Planctomycetota bacterium]